MIKSIQEALTNDEQKVPHFSNGVIEYLQSRFNFTYQEADNQLFRLKQAGYSEAYIMGYVAGLNYASTIIDNAVRQREELKDVDTVTFK